MHHSLKDVSLENLSQEEKAAILYGNYCCEHCFDTQIIVDAKGVESPCSCQNNN